MMRQNENNHEFSQLITRVRQGDESAWPALVQLYEPPLRRAAQVFLGPELRSALDPMDLVQAVHCLLIVGIREAKFEIATPGQFLALAKKLLRRQLARYWRHWKGHKPNDGKPGEVPHTSSLVGPPENDPAQAAQDHDEVEHFLHTLDETERLLVGLRLQGYNTAEVARALDLDPNVLRMRLSRLRQRLRATPSFGEWL